MIRPYTTEVELELTVRVLSAHAGRPGHFHGPPDAWEPADPPEVELAVTLGTLDVTAALPSDVLEALAADALERLADAAEP